jgi:hypothetical protein
MDTHAYKPLVNGRLLPSFIGRPVTFFGRVSSVSLILVLSIHDFLHLTLKKSSSSELACIASDGANIHVLLDEEQVLDLSLFHFRCPFALNSTFSTT